MQIARRSVDAVCRVASVEDRGKNGEYFTQQAGARTNLMRQIHWLLKRCSEVKGTSRDLVRAKPTMEGSDMLTSPEVEVILLNTCAIVQTCDLQI